MSYPYVSVSFLTSFLMLFALGLHCSLYTESSIIKGFGGGVMLVLTRFTKFVSVLFMFVLFMIVTAGAFKLFGYDVLTPYLDALIGPRLWWMVYTEGFNVFSSILVWSLFWMHNVRKFGSTSADYNNWDEYQHASHTTYNTTIINMDGRRWNPWQTVEKASLSTRATSRASKNSSRSSSSSNSLQSSRSPMMVAPLPIPMSSRSTKSSSRTSSSSKSSGNSDWIGKLGQGIVLLVAILILVLYTWGAWKLVDMMSDYFDETVVMDAYLEAAA